MATVILDPMYKEISGRTGGVVHYKWKGIHCIRAYVVPVNPDTEKQRTNRNRFGLAAKSWRTLPETVKEMYNRKADKLKLDQSGYNLYVSDCMNGRVYAGKQEKTVAQVKTVKWPEKIILRESFVFAHTLSVYASYPPGR